MVQLAELIQTYYTHRGLKWPNVDKALQFLETEKAEVYELLLARDGGWKRNNPGNKPAFNRERLAEELGDCIMMAMVAGIVEGVDPVEALVNKIHRKLQENVHGEK
jgi:NTP pyrophosphatase (non-canonical NTP hydrolase)